MAFVEKASAVRQVFQLVATHTHVVPRDVVLRAAKSHGLEQGKAWLKETAVERSVVRNDQLHVAQTILQGQFVEALPTHHVVGDVMDGRGKNEINTVSENKRKRSEENEIKAKRKRPKNNEIKTVISFVSYYDDNSNGDNIDNNDGNTNNDDDNSNSNDNIT